MSAVDISFDELSIALSYAYFNTSGVAAVSASKEAPQPKKEVAKKEAAPKKSVDDDFDNMFGDEEPPKKKEAPKKSADDDFDNMFGDEDEKPKVEEEEPNEYGETADDAAATKARQERMAHALKLKQQKEESEGKKKKEKEKPVEKSLIILEVKPWEADCDLAAVFQEIVQFEKEGLVWGQAFELVPVAYGIKKLVMQCVIVDSLVLMDDITEHIESLEQWVQSVNVTAMTKV